MKIDGYTRMAAVVANPIKHSLSPFIHNMAFELTGENGVYLAWEIEPADLPETIANIKRLGMYGVNLSMPYKQAVIPLLDELSPAAQMIGAVNTVALQAGKLIGHNTDGLGFFKSLESFDFSPKGQELTILGAGGAGISLIAQAVLSGAEQINVFIRRSEDFEAVRERLADLSESISLYDLADVSLLQEKITASSLLVNATPVGMTGEGMAVPANIKLPQNIIVADLIYKTKETPFLKWAKAQDVPTTNGLGMLLYQAAAAFEIWTGKAMPVVAIKAAMETE